MPSYFTCHFFTNSQWASILDLFKCIFKGQRLKKVVFQSIMASSLVYKIYYIAHFGLEIDQCEIIEVIMMVTLRHVDED